MLSKYTCNTLFVFPNCRVLDTLFQLLLTYFYLSLALRENVLRANGSNIQRWWIWHHYVSLLLTMTMTTWPATETYNYFRLPFYMYALYAGKYLYSLCNSLHILISQLYSSCYRCSDDRYHNCASRVIDRYNHLYHNLMMLLW